MSNEYGKALDFIEGVCATCYPHAVSEIMELMVPFCDPRLDFEMRNYPNDHSEQQRLRRKIDDALFWINVGGYRFHHLNVKFFENGNLRDRELGFKELVPARIDKVIAEVVFTEEIRMRIFLYGTRMMIEKHFRCLKLFFGLVTSVPRSVTGYFANYFYALAAYQINRLSLPILP